MHRPNPVMHMVSLPLYPNDQVQADKPIFTYSEITSSADAGSNLAAMPVILLSKHYKLALIQHILRPILARCMVDAALNPSHSQIAQCLLVLSVTQATM